MATGKIEPQTTEQKTDAIYHGLKWLKSAGGVGTGIIGALILGGVAWLDSRIDSRIQAALDAHKTDTGQMVRQAVREENMGIQERVTRLEIRAEMEREKK